MCSFHARHKVVFRIAIQNVQERGERGMIGIPTKESPVAKPEIYTCRFSPSMARFAEMRSAGRKLRPYAVPVTFWSYADDRLDSRCPAERNEALVKVRAYDATEARQLVWREWGNVSGLESVGQADLDYSSLRQEVEAALRS